MARRAGRAQGKVEGRHERVGRLWRSSGRCVFPFLSSLFTAGVCFLAIGGPYSSVEATCGCWESPRRSPPSLSPSSARKLTLTLPLPSLLSQPNAPSSPSSPLLHPSSNPPPSNPTPAPTSSPSSPPSPTALVPAPSPVKAPSRVPPAVIRARALSSVAAAGRPSERRSRARRRRVLTVPRRRPQPLPAAASPPSPSVRVTVTPVRAAGSVRRSRRPSAAFLVRMEEPGRPSMRSREGGRVRIRLRVGLRETASLRVKRRGGMGRVRSTEVDMRGGVRFDSPLFFLFSLLNAVVCAPFAYSPLSTCRVPLRLRSRRRFRRRSHHQRVNPPFPRSRLRFSTFPFAFATSPPLRPRL